MTNSEKTTLDKAEYNRRYRERNKEKIAEKNKSYQTRNREKHLARCREYHRTHKAILSEKRKLYAQENKEKVAEQRRQSRQRHLVVRRQNDQDYYYANRERRLAYEKAKYQKKRDEIRAQQSQYAESNKDRIRARVIERIYKVNSAYIEGLRDQQNNSCVLCSRSFEVVKMAIDHCHSTGKVRGLLCTACNFSLGHVEKPGFLPKAVSYIRRHREQHWKEILGDLY